MNGLIFANFSKNQVYEILKIRLSAIDHFIL